jgi:hypothetical protein
VVAESRHTYDVLEDNLLLPHIVIDIASDIPGTRMRSASLQQNDATDRTPYLDGRLCASPGAATSR